MCCSRRVYAPAGERTIGVAMIDDDLCLCCGRPFSEFIRIEERDENVVESAIVVYWECPDCEVTVPEDEL